MARIIQCQVCNDTGCPLTDNEAYCSCNAGTFYQERDESRLEQEEEPIDTDYPDLWDDYPTLSDLESIRWCKICKGGGLISNDPKVYCTCNIGIRSKADDERGYFTADDGRVYYPCPKCNKFCSWNETDDPEWKMCTLDYNETVKRSDIFFSELPFFMPDDNDDILVDVMIIVGSIESKEELVAYNREISTFENLLN